MRHDTSRLARILFPQLLAHARLCQSTITPAIRLHGLLSVNLPLVALLPLSIFTVFKNLSGFCATHPILLSGRSLQQVWEMAVSNDPLLGLNPSSEQGRTHEVFSKFRPNDSLGRRRDRIQALLNRLGSKLRGQYLRLKRKISASGLKFKSISYDDQVSGKLPVILDIPSDRYHSNRHNNMTFNTMLSVRASGEIQDPYGKEAHLRKQRVRKWRRSDATAVSRMSDATLVAPLSPQTEGCATWHHRFSDATLDVPLSDFPDVSTQQPFDHFPDSKDSCAKLEDHLSDQVIVAPSDNQSVSHDSEQTASVQVYPTNMPRPRLFADNMKFARYPSCMYRSLSMNSKRSLSISSSKRSHRPNVIEALKFKDRNQDPMPTFLEWAKVWLHNRHTGTAQPAESASLQ